MALQGIRVHWVIPDLEVLGILVLLVKLAVRINFQDTLLMVIKQYFLYWIRLLILLIFLLLLMAS